MSSRSYLSIGDVLTLLRQEFPDVTISKIRFLESQGLVNPERTPSGYRKFYDHDVERLRWVLRQQREHFLPLKVIKDRLDEDPGGAERSGSATAEPAVADGAEEPVLVGQRARSQTAAVAGRGVTGANAGGSGAGGVGVDTRSGEESTPTRVGDGSTLPGIETSLISPPTAGGPSPDGRPGGSSGPPVVAAAAVSASGVRSSDRATSSGPTGAGPGPAGSAGSDVKPDRPVPAGSTPAAARRTKAARPEAAGSAVAGSAAAGHTPVPPVPPAPPVAKAAATPTGPAVAAGAGNGDAAGPASAGPTGASMSLDELCAASGLEPAVIVDLQEYGLLRSMTVAGLEYFDEESLVIATVTAQFAQFGVEPRHLRLYKNAADREAGFVEQIVLPLVRQRNPEARVRAHQTVDELGALGQQIRGALLRGALKDLLDP